MCLHVVAIKWHNPERDIPSVLGPQCVTCNLCGCGSLLDFIFSGAACAWWATASLVFGKYATQANEANLPEAQWRAWIIILSWVQAAIFVAIAGISLIRCGPPPPPRPRPLLRLVDPLSSG